MSSYLLTADLIKYQSGNCDIVMFDEEGVAYMREATPEEIKILTKPEPPVDPWLKSFFGDLV